MNLRGPDIDDNGVWVPCKINPTQADVPIRVITFNIKGLSVEERGRVVDVLLDGMQLRRLPDYFTLHDEAEVIGGQLFRKWHVTDSHWYYPGGSPFYKDVEWVEMEVIRTKKDDKFFEVTLGAKISIGDLIVYMKRKCAFIVRLRGNDAVILDIQPPGSFFEVVDRVVIHDEVPSENDYDSDGSIIPGLEPKRGDAPRRTKFIDAPRGINLDDASEAELTSQEIPFPDSRDLFGDEFQEIEDERDCLDFMKKKWHWLIYDDDGSPLDHVVKTLKILGMTEDNLQMAFLP